MTGSVRDISRAVVKYHGLCQRRIPVEVGFVIALPLLQRVHDLIEMAAILEVLRLRFVPATEDVVDLE